MSTLAEELAALDPGAQAQLARARAPVASTEELIDVLLKVQPRGWTEHHVIHALTSRGQEIFEPVARALLADPLAPGASMLGEVLVRLFADDEIRDPRVVPTLVQAVEAVLDAGAGTQGVGGYMLLLGDCATIAGPLPEARATARRVLYVAGTEVDPCPFAVAGARRLTDPPR